MILHRASDWVPNGALSRSPTRAPNATGCLAGSLRTYSAAAGTSCGSREAFCAATILATASSTESDPSSPPLRLLLGHGTRYVRHARGAYAYRTVRPRLARVLRAHSAKGPGASCPAPQVRTARRRLGTEAPGRTCQHSAALERERRPLYLVLTHHAKDGDLIGARDLDLLAERTAARVDLRAQPRRTRLGDHLVAKRQEVVAHGQQPQLRRREPKGEVAGSALDEDAEEALDGSFEGEEVRVRRFG